MSDTSLYADPDTTADPAPDPDLTIFPNSIVATLVTAFGDVPSVGTVFKRTLRLDDPTYSIGVSAQDWVPTGYETGVQGPSQKRYNVAVQTLIRAAGEDDGLLASNVFAASIVKMLYIRDGVVLQLAALRDADTGERFAGRYGVTRQQYAGTSLLYKKSLLFFTSLQLWVETTV